MQNRSLTNARLEYITSSGKTRSAHAKFAKLCGLTVLPHAAATAATAAAAAASMTRIWCTVTIHMRRTQPPAVVRSRRKLGPLRSGCRRRGRRPMWTYRALHGSAPPYLASSFACVADMPHRRRLRSASTEQLDVPTCRRSTIGGRAFPVAGAKVWNGLTSEVTSASSLSVFKNRLKIYLFRRCYETV